MALAQAVWPESARPTAAAPVVWSSSIPGPATFETVYQEQERLGAGATPGPITVRDVAPWDPPAVRQEPEPTPGPRRRRGGDKGPTTWMQGGMTIEEGHNLLLDAGVIPIEVLQRMPFGVDGELLDI